ncbi:2-dehydropantoate 2-reductase [Polynucleobacter sp. UK-Kesae-W10]|uniref:ketopantoate reductase family protein n=1 Tax=Polynucleobacter sp. UK-Kesae-W10 TaxID=1819738 RepID=UPI001C0ABD78|nr:2-dehydropantoate 2-reductase [Polynucleobacter sp. UK-Kesae-W10]
MPKFQKIYVLGAGAVGCYFGGILARANFDVTLIARPERVLALNTFGLEMDCQSFRELVHPKASSDLSILADADLVLLSVKSPDTEKVIQDIASILPRHAVILSLQNGVENIDIVANILCNPVYAAVVYVATEMIGHKTLKHHGRGELFIGKPQALTKHDQENLTGICDLFVRAQIPCEIASNIKKDMWLKFLVNCAYNGLSGIKQMPYGEMMRIPEVVQQIEKITEEFLVIAALEDIAISEAEAKNANELIASSMATQRSSTAQDLVRGKKTEIDFLNGYIVQLGKKHGFPVPYNKSVYDSIKTLERP